MTGPAASAIKAHQPETGLVGRWACGPVPW